VERKHVDVSNLYCFNTTTLVPKINAIVFNHWKHSFLSVSVTILAVQLVTEASHGGDLTHVFFCLQVLPRLERQLGPFLFFSFFSCCNADSIRGWVLGCICTHALSMSIHHAMQCICVQGWRPRSDVSLHRRCCSDLHRSGASNAASRCDISTLRSTTGEGSLASVGTLALSLGGGELGNTSVLLGGLRRDDTTTGDSSLDEDIELFVVANSVLEVTRGDTLDAVLKRNVTSELKNLSAEVLKNGSAVDSGGGTDTLLAVDTGLQETVDTTDGELKTSALGAGDGLGLASLGLALTAGAGLALALTALR